ncbi:hypothetical protein CPB83DRAFT_906667 [Crepidotus variabilis]|uniref:Uncharacterized protein n=1 Tax=Crepidotus variabilis TaxID=179855 RepID=A0A9P6EGV7_9AGAR|nr:hypothetical protein CPB83DRAFT_906667 [Crepidotus variabilis]
MVQIIATLIATTLFVSSALANPHHYRRESFTQNDLLDRELPELVTREDVKLMLQRSLDMADQLDERDPFFGFLAKAAFRIGKTIHHAVQNRRHRRDLEGLEERDFSEGSFYDDLD